MAEGGKLGGGEELRPPASELYPSEFYPNATKNHKLGKLLTFFEPILDSPFGGLGP